MPTRKKHIINVHTGTGTTAPTGAELFLGEIAVQHTPAEPALWIKTGTNEASTDYEKFIGETAINNKLLSGLTGVTLNGSAATVNNQVAELTTSIIYAGTADPSPSLGNNGDVYIQTKSVVLYETDGTTGLLGHNQSSFDNQWQLENMDFTPYRLLKCYFKASNLSDATGYTPAIVVEVPLDTAAKGPTIYVGGQMVPLPFNRNRQYLVSCAVDATKTKFQVIHQNTIWDVTTSDANNNGRYLYKIEGYI